MGFSSSGGAKVGTIELWGGSTAPDGYLLCNGGAVSRSLYADLFAVIGTTYGAGDGSTTFNLPNSSNLVTSVNTSVPIKGDGKSLGLTNANNQNFGIRGSGSQTVVATGQYGVTLPKSIGDNYSPANQYVWGVTTDSSKSGIVGTVTRTVLTCKHIIKY